MLRGSVCVTFATLFSQLFLLVCLLMYECHHPDRLFLTVVPIGERGKHLPTTLKQYLKKRKAIIS